VSRLAEDWFLHLKARVVIKADYYGGVAWSLTTVLLLLSADVTKLYLVKSISTWGE
jgi:hypothetical protein